MQKTPNLVLTYERELNQLLTLTRAHNTQHPDRNVCGGVGSCLLMRTEVEQEQELNRIQDLIAEAGYQLKVTVQ